LVDGIGSAIMTVGFFGSGSGAGLLLAGRLRAGFRCSGPEGDELDELDPELDDEDEV